VFRVMPQDDKFFSLLNSAAANAVDTAAALSDLVQHFDNLQAKSAHIKELESRGDSITHDVITRLNQTFVTPIDREDIHAIASHMDDIVDWMEAAAARLAMYRIEVPTAECVALVEVIEQSVQEVRAAVAALPARNFELVRRHSMEINRLENEADRLLREDLAQLFATEKDPLNVIKWKEIYETLEVVTDECEDVAHLLESVVMKNA